MLRCALPLAVIAAGLSTSVHSATLDRDWARVYNRSGSESALAIWPAPGGGVDIVANRSGELVYLQYDQAGVLAAERATGVGIGTMWLSVLANDGVGGFVLAAQQDSAGSEQGLVQLRVSANGQVIWRNPLRSFIEYPAAIKVANDRVYLGINEDYYTTYDPSLLISDLSNGALLCQHIGRGGHYQRITDMCLRDGGGITLIGSGQCYGASPQGKALAGGGDECYLWLTDFADDCLVTRDRYYPSHHYLGSLERLGDYDVLLTTSHEQITPIADASFSITWFAGYWPERIPRDYVDSRDLRIGGCRAAIIERSLDVAFIAGEHDAGNGAQELLLGIAGYGLDVGLTRPNPAKSYAAIQLAPVSQALALLGVESDIGGGSEARIVLLFDEQMLLQDYDVDDHIVDPVGMAIGEDGGIYTAGSGPPSLEGIIVTKLLVNAAPSGVPEAAIPRRGRLGIPSPNPAASSVRFDYEVGSDGDASLEIYDPAGRLVARLVEGMSQPGKHVVEWNTRDVPNGVYLARFRSGSSYAVRKVVVTK